MLVFKKVPLSFSTCTVQLIALCKQPEAASWKIVKGEGRQLKETVKNCHRLCTLDCFPAMLILWHVVQ
jgi:hypothetical protein